MWRGPPGALWIPLSGICVGICGVIWIWGGRLATELQLSEYVVSICNLGGPLAALELLLSEYVVSFAFGAGRWQPSPGTPAVGDTLCTVDLGRGAGNPKGTIVEYMWCHSKLLLAASLENIGFGDWDGLSVHFKR